MRLQSYEWGDRNAPALVCLHGVTSYGEQFARLAERLPGYRILAFDLRGHGRSGYEPPWSIATHLADVIETAEASGVSQASWLGHSFGGRLVLELAAKRPDLTGKLVLLDPAIRLRPDIALRLADLARQTQLFARAQDAVPPPCSGTRFLASDETRAEEIRQHLESSPEGFRWRFSPSAVVAILGELATWPPPPEELGNGLLFVTGKKESVVGEGQLRRYRRALGDRLEHVSVPGGHVVLWDAFDETAEAVRSYLDRD